jgi:hypothetical protein
MSAIVISKVAPIVAVADMNGNATASANAATPDPKEVVVMSGSVGNGWLKLDLGSSQLIDGFFLGFSSGITADVYVGNSSGSQGAYLGNCPLAASDVSNPYRRHGYVKGGPISGRYVDVVLFHSGLASVGIFAALTSVQPQYGRGWGSGRAPVDMSNVTELRSGGFAVDPGGRKANFRFTCSELTDGEVASLWRIAEEVGIGSPAVVVEDPDATAGLNERLNYGLFNRPEAYERQSPGQNAWSFTLNRWV